jgi:hypothetical protein
LDRRDTLRLISLGLLAGTAAKARIGAAEPTKTRRAPLSKAFRDSLVEVYGAEVLGESLFGEMLDAAKTPGEVYVLGSMLQLETEGKATLRPLLARLGLPLREDGESRTQGATSAARLNGLPWAERFGAIHDAIEKNFLPRYLALAEQVSAEEDPDAAKVAAFMGRHERAILAATAEVVKGAADPIAPLTPLLRYPLARP